MLWDKQYLEECKKGEDVQGETLNSVNITLNKLYGTGNNEKENHQKERGTKHISKKYTVTRYAENIDNFKFLDGTGFDEFVELYHTLGNFMPVPWGCNFPRGNSKVNDYWDLTILHIYQYYTAGNNIEDIKTILSPKKIADYDGLVKKYKEWLDSFGNWENFVNKNYLHAFVEYKSDGTLYPKELWKGHFIGQVLPDKEQCEEYFKNAAECIRERTNHLLEALKRLL